MFATEIQDGHDSLGHTKPYGYNLLYLMG